MIHPDEARARLLALAMPVETETLPLSQAAGRWTAAAALALRTQPAHDLSAMDGYAIRRADVPGPWRIIGESAAGAPFNGQVGTNEATRISTGAALPAGANAIVIQEDVVRDGDQLTLTRDGSQAEHVRRAGSDFSAGQKLVDAGTHLTAARIALAAIAGHAALAVRRRIRVAFVSSGSELVEPGSGTDADRLPASNALMLAAMLRTLPVDTTDYGIVPDVQASLTSTFAQAADHDIIVSTGGASVGDHDLVRPALIGAGAKIDFWKVAVRPGKPLLVGKLGKAVVLGLPGNPVSAFVTAELFLKPLVAHLSGAAEVGPMMRSAHLAAPLPAVGVRTDYLRARWIDGAIAPLCGDSGMLVPLAAAAALIVRPAGAPAAKAGDKVDIIDLA